MHGIRAKSPYRMIGKTGHPKSTGKNTLDPSLFITITVMQKIQNLQSLNGCRVMVTPRKRFAPLRVLQIIAQAQPRVLSALA